MHPFHRRSDAALAAAWTFLIGIVGADAAAAAGAPTHPPDGFRALAVTLVLAMTMTRAADHSADRVCAVLAKDRVVIEEIKAEQRALVAIGEEISEHRAGHPPLINGSRPRRSQAKYSRDTGWVI